MHYKIKDIVDYDLCSGCGVCISESLDSSMVWSGEGFLVPDISKEFKDNAIKVCPFNPSPDMEVEDEDRLADLFLRSATKCNHRIGHYSNCYVGFSKKFRSTSSSGGIATYIFEALLKEKVVDHLFIVKERDGTFEYQWFNDVENILGISKTKYFPVTMEKLFLEIDKLEGKVAVSGVASFIKAIRLKQYYYPEYREKISFLVGIICGGLKSKYFTNYLAQRAGIQGNYFKQEYRIKNEQSDALDYAFGAFDSDNKYYQKKMREIGDTWGTALFNATAYDLNTDVTTELADISLGDAWIEPFKSDGHGNNLIITRSELAEKLIVEGINNKYLNISEISLELVLKSQSGGFNHKQKAISYRYNSRVKRGLLVPFIRKRLLEKISFEFQWVQMARSQMKAKSIALWIKHKDAVLFDKNIKYYRLKLKVLTRFYHKLSKFKK